MSDSGRPQAGFGDHPAWLLALAALLAWQVWLTLGLFGRDRPWRRLLDDEPVLSGRHPLHLYHGYLGARSLWERGTPSCYDPAFCAGYPKTPVFDGGSRPAELALALAGARFSPAAYKVGHALLFAAAPLLLFAAARGAGAPRAGACLAAALGLLVWWGRPCQEALAAGDVDLLLASLLVLAQAGLLVRYHHAPGPLGLLGVILTGWLAWFAHPLLVALLLPLFLVYYLSAGPRHPLGWHAPLLGGLALAVAANAFWLIDWVRYLWIRVPLQLDRAPLARATPRGVWEAPLWGGPIDRGLACGLALAAAAGVLLYNENGRRAAARLLGLGWAGFLALAVLGAAWEPAGRLGAAQLLLPALLFAAVPAAHALTEGLRLCRGWGPQALAGPAVLAAGLGALAWAAAPGPAAAWARRLAETTPWEIGLGERHLAVVAALEGHTTDQARVLWEDRRAAAGASRWTALLPRLTGRSFVGGLDPDAGIEHAAAGLVDGALADRPLAEWADADLDDYCRRYNVGWVVCWTDAARARLARWPGAEAVAELPGQDGEAPGRLFRLRREPSFALAGKARWLSADAQRILLADVKSDKSDDGEVVLSLHYQAGMRVTPSRVRLERAVGPHDPIPFVRLRLTGEVSRVMITWEGR